MPCSFHLLQSAKIMKNSLSNNTYSSAFLSMSFGNYVNNRKIVLDMIFSCWIILNIISNIIIFLLQLHLKSANTCNYFNFCNRIDYFHYIYHLRWVVCVCSCACAWYWSILNQGAGIDCSTALPRVPVDRSARVEYDRDSWVLESEWGVPMDMVCLQWHYSRNQEVRNTSISAVLVACGRAATCWARTPACWARTGTVSSRKRRS